MARVLPSLQWGRHPSARNKTSIDHLSPYLSLKEPTLGIVQVQGAEQALRHDNNLVMKASNPDETYRVTTGKCKPQCARPQ